MRIYIIPHICITLTESPDCKLCRSPYIGRNRTGIVYDKDNLSGADQLDQVYSNYRNLANIIVTFWSWPRCLSAIWMYDKNLLSSCIDQMIERLYLIDFQIATYDPAVLRVIWALSGLFNMPKTHFYLILQRTIQHQRGNQIVAHCINYLEIATFFLHFFVVFIANIKMNL